MHGVDRAISIAILPLYFVVTLSIGWWARRGNTDAKAYLSASRSLPLWVVVAAYLASNCGALEIVGLSAVAAQYGAQAFHFYWLGAIPAMVFLAIWMMPVYRRSGVGSVPEYLEARYSPAVRLFNAGVLAVTTLLLAGISLYAMAQVLGVVIGLPFAVSVTFSGAIVLLYVLLGGIRATIYNEVFQLLVMFVGLVPLAARSARLLWHGDVLVRPDRVHLWRTVPFFKPAASLDSFGVIFGLGAVLSLSYWCTDFVLMQRAFTARTESEARQVPLWAGFGKLAFSFIVVLPGLVASGVLASPEQTQRYDQVLPAMMKAMYGPVMLSLGLTALAASLMSGLAANVSAFAALWTEDIYRARLRPHAEDRHYLNVGRLSAGAAILLSVMASYLNFLFSDLMEHVQLIFAVFAAPFWAIFLLGMSSKRVNARAALAGLLSGTATGVLHLIASTRGIIHYGSVMNSNFHGAFYAFCAAVLGALLVTCFSEVATTQGTSAAPSTLVFRWRPEGEGLGLLWVLSGALLLAVLGLNVLWR